MEIYASKIRRGNKILSRGNEMLKRIDEMIKLTEWAINNYIKNGLENTNSCVIYKSHLSNLEELKKLREKELKNNVEGK